MTEAAKNDTNTITEKAIIASASALSAADDAPLLHLCAELHALNEHIEELSKIMDHEPGNEVDKAAGRWNDLAEQIGDIQARSIPGLVAKARVSVSIVRDFKGHPEKEWMPHEDFLPLSLAEDLVAFGTSQTTV